MRLDTLTRPELILPSLRAEGRDDVLHRLAEHLAEHGEVEDADALFDKLVEREELGSTGIGSQVAIPHCKLEGLDEPVLAIARSKRGVDFGALDGEPVRVFFLVVSPTDSPAVHLQALAALSRWIKTDGHVAAVLDQGDAKGIYDLLSEGS